MADKSGDVELVVSALSGFTAEQTRALALGIQADLVETTPVDTGWARANWVPSIGTPSEGLAGNHKAISGAEQAAGTAEVAAYGKIDQGPIYLTNNVPYIQPLNDGHSQQAPAGFVQAAIARNLAEVEK